MKKIRSRRSSLGNFLFGSTLNDQQQLGTFILLGFLHSLYNYNYDDQTFKFA